MLTRSSSPVPRATGRREWLPVAGLLALSAVPVLAGLFRTGGLVFGTEHGPDLARHVDHVPALAVHVVSVSIWCVLGAFQFVPRIRRHRPAWHRGAGWFLVATGLVVAGSGAWLSHVFPPGELDGPWLYAMRMLVSAAMAVFIALGVRAIRRREVRTHRAWMTRAYALALGAGTQVATHIPMLAIEAWQTELGRNLAMGAGWGINALFAEWVLRRRPARVKPSPALGLVAGTPSAAAHPALRTRDSASRTRSPSPHASHVVPAPTRAKGTDR